MFTLYDKRNELYQWDINRKVIIDDTTIDEVHFCNKTSDCSLKVFPYEYNNLFVADIPNILLQESFPIKVYAYLSDGYTMVEECLKVKARTKPSDYRYEETTVIKLDDLINRADNAIQQAEQSAQEADKTATDLYDYVDSHMLQLTDDGEGNVTLEGVAHSGGGGSADLSNYYTKEETNTAISTAIADIDIPDVTGFAKLEDIPTIPENVSSFNNDAGYLTEHQSLEGYAKLTDIPTNYLTEVPAEYITETELAGKGYLTEHQSLEGYAKTTDIPDVSKYQTADQVTALINEALGVIENGSY